MTREPNFWTETIQQVGADFAKAAAEIDREAIPKLPADFFEQLYAKYGNLNDPEVQADIKRTAVMLDLLMNVPPSPGQ